LRGNYVAALIEDQTEEVKRQIEDIEHLVSVLMLRRGPAAYV